MLTPIASALMLAMSAGVPTYDLVVYGSSPAALTAAIQAQRMGASVVIVSPETRIGGLTTGGLGQTDIGNKAAFGGLALSFYRDVASAYRDEANWTWQKRGDYLPDGQCSGSTGADSMWTFEPHVALQILERWEREEKLEIHRGRRLNRAAGKTKIEGEGEQRRIVSFETEDGTVYRGRMFVDATYEGDLMAAAGVSYCVGREANSVYGETISGNAPTARGSDHHNFQPGVDPYVMKGDPKSGLLPNVEPYDPNEKPGDGDRRVQAYCFRMCLTDVPENRIPFAKPAGYDERDYELLFRNFEASPKGMFDGDLTWKLPWINSKMPNRKTDTNNRDGFSTDFIGRNWNWPEASYAEREKILREHLDYQRGLMWTLANHPRIPERVRQEVSRWGTCRDEFQDGLGDGWQRQLYVREARRLVGDTIMTEHHCRGTQIARRPVALGAYGMDSHHVRRHVTKDGFVRNEGNVEDYKAADGKTRFPPYGIDYGAIVPKRGECANLFVPVCLSASHMAFGSIRMEPVFFALGQVAGTAAAQALAAGVAVQDLPYEPLKARLLADGQVLSWTSSEMVSRRVARDVVITAYGAEKNGAKCTEAFAKAIAACSESGGGRVVVPAGRWFSGAIRFRSNCELHLEEGAEILFSQDPVDYLPAVQTSWEGMECWNYCPLVYAYCCTNVAITGTGTLRAYEGEWKDTKWYPWVGQENGVRAARRQLYDWGATDYPVEKRQVWKMKNANTRPHFVQFNRCHGVRWEGFKVRNSPFWTIHLYMCDDALVRGLDVCARGNNNDGIDIEMCRNVLVEDCTFDQGDDGVVIKSGRNRDAWRINQPCENVLIRNCRVVNAHTLLGIGSEVSGGVRNVRMVDCTGDAVDRVIYLKTNHRRGGFIENVSVENVVCREVRKSILEIGTDVLYEWADFPDYETALTRISDIAVSNVTCRRTARLVKIAGDARRPVENVRVQGVCAEEITAKAVHVENVKNFSK